MAGGPSFEQPRLGYSIKLLEEDRSRRISRMFLLRREAGRRRRRRKRRLTGRWGGEEKDRLVAAWIREKVISQEETGSMMWVWMIVFHEDLEIMLMVIDNGIPDSKLIIRFYRFRIIELIIILL